MLNALWPSEQVLRNSRLPDKECDFFTALTDYFPCFFDIKVPFRGGASFGARFGLRAEDGSASRGSPIHLQPRFGLGYVRDGCSLFLADSCSRNTLADSSCFTAVVRGSALRTKIAHGLLWWIFGLMDWTGSMNPQLLQYVAP